MLRSDHFSLTVPRRWVVVRAPGPATGPAIVRVPRGAGEDAHQGVHQGAHQGAHNDASLELYVYPWLARAAIEQPTQEALRRLISDGVLDPKIAAPVDEARCPDIAGQLRMLGALEPAVHLETSSGDHLIVVGGQSRGSLIAMLGVVTGRGSVCDNVVALQAAMREMGSGLDGYDPSDHARIPTPDVAAFPPYPVPQLPSVPTL